MCSTDVYCSKQTGSSSTKETSPIISSFLELGRRKLSMQPKFVAAQMLLKQKPMQQFVNGLLGFITLGIYTPLEARVLTIIAWVAHRCRRLYLHCSLIYFWVPSSCFCIVISLSCGEIIPPFSGVCQSGGGCIIHAGGGGGHALTDRLLWCATDDDQRQHHHAEHHFSALASANSFGILHRAQQHHADASACQ